MRYICEAAIVVLAICANIASVGYKIAVEKDWIVVIAGKNDSFLASKLLDLKLFCHVYDNNVVSLNLLDFSKNKNYVLLCLNGKM